MLAWDINYAQKHPGVYQLHHDYKGTVVAVKFRGKYFRFTPDREVLAQLINRRWTGQATNAINKRAEPR